MNYWSNKKNNIFYLLFFVFFLALAYFINVNFRSKLLYIALSKSLFWLCVPIFIFSIFTLFMNSSVFLAWRKFTNYYLIISIFIILITPTSTHGMDFLPIIKERVTILLAGIYSAFSFVVILYRYFKSKKLNA